MEDLRIRIRVSAESGFRELYDDLQSVPDRHRGDRIRVLATLGLAALSDGVGQPSEADQIDGDTAREIRGPAEPVVEETPAEPAGDPQVKAPPAATDSDADALNQRKRSLAAAFAESF